VSAEVPLVRNSGSGPRYDDAPGAEGIELFSADGLPVSGDVTEQLVLRDAGTEVNEVPGAGPNQAPRQPTPNAGPSAEGDIGPVDDEFAYPAPREVLRVMITPEPPGAPTN